MEIWTGMEFSIPYSHLYNVPLTVCFNVVTFQNLVMSSSNTESTIVKGEKSDSEDQISLFGTDSFNDMDNFGTDSIEEIANGTI